MSISHPENDPDGPADRAATPLTGYDVARMKRTLRDREQGRSEPGAPARAYLAVIAVESETIARALHNPLRAS